MGWTKKRVRNFASLLLLGGTSLLLLGGIGIDDDAIY
jgi:hypothetical protein